MVDDITRVVSGFAEATNRHDVDAMLTMISDDFVFESTVPPDGQRLVERKLSERCGKAFSRIRPNASVDTEELIVCGDRCIALLRCVFDDTNPEGGHVRAVDVLRVHQGKLTKKRSYVKGEPVDAFGVGARLSAALRQSWARRARRRSAIAGLR